MSLKNITVGLLFGICLLAGGFAVWWRFSIHPLWIPGTICFLTVAVISMKDERQRRAFLQRYWDRACTGLRWRRRFPGSSPTEIREFLRLFVEAFGLPRKRRLCFSPEDKPLEVYRGLYPDWSMADGLELETLVSRLSEKYKIDVEKGWRQEITLGELFAHTRAS
jgi:hypothetical protein